MTNEQININIAQACGYRVALSDLQSGLDLLKNGERIPLPDYCNDLNAMHEAEKVLLKIDNSQAYWFTYSNKLTRLLGSTDVFHATARQRAETFLKTIGKWEEAK